MIGNDVVDTHLATSNTNWKRKGYLQKLFTPREQGNILNSSKPDEELWLYWAMKEATYKAHQRRFNLPRSYNPTKFSCEIEERNGTSIFGQVKVETFSYFTKTSIKADHLHSISSAEKIIKYYHEVLKTGDHPASGLLTKFSELKGLSGKEIKIQKNRNFVPQISLQNQILEESFSISHHGRFSAYVLALMNY